MVDLVTRIGALTLANPVMPASGTFGPELSQVFDLDRLGALVTKSVTPGYRAGNPLPFEAAGVSARLKAARETHIRLLLTHGDSAVRFWTCDLTAEYVRLNADYTT